MKRLWLALLSLGLVLAFSASAMAVDVKFSDSFEAAGMYLDKTGLNADPSLYLSTPWGSHEEQVKVHDYLMSHGYTSGGAWSYIQSNDHTLRVLDPNNTSTAFYHQRLRVETFAQLNSYCQGFANFFGS